MWVEMSGKEKNLLPLKSNSKKCALLKILKRNVFWCQFSKSSKLYYRKRKIKNEDDLNNNQEKKSGLMM